MSDKYQYTVERLSAANIGDMARLYTTVYNKQVAPGFFEKKYNTAFTNVQYTGFLAYDVERMPIAFYGVIPCFIKSGDNSILSAQSADTMTHPEHRNKGLFVELALTTFQLCRELNIRLLFGFPNQNSLPGFVNKLGWQVSHTMDCFIIRTGNFPGNRLFSNIPVIKTLYRKYQNGILNKYMVKQSEPDNSVFKDGCGGVYRDSNYFNYKTYTNTCTIKAGRSTVWIKISDILLIGDAAVEADDFDDMVYTLKKIAAKLGLKQIHFHASPGTTLHSLFAMRFRSIHSFQVILKNLGEDIPLDKIKFTSADIDTF
jgi:hypothetical protein